jgi:NAD(P)-dependent dehydrogenase (short-subunit alcohol dehydrogenase family)
MKTDDKNKFQKAKVLVVGATGGIGSAFVEKIKQLDNNNVVIEVVRKKQHNHQIEVDMLDEQSMTQCAQEIHNQHGSIDIILNTVGLLHSDDVMPERALKEITQDFLQKTFEANTFIPFMVSKYFIPLLSKENTSLIAFMSARIGSISDNNLGGWYSYRASKAALNMLIKTLSIELSYKNKNAICIGLHPGTVKTNLSDPFSEKIKAYKVFSKEESIDYLVNQINRVDQTFSGKLIDWKGDIIPY